MLAIKKVFESSVEVTFYKEGPSVRKEGWEVQPLGITEIFTVKTTDLFYQVVFIAAASGEEKLGQSENSSIFVMWLLDLVVRER